MSDDNPPAAPPPPPHEEGDDSGPPAPRSPGTPGGGGYSPPPPPPGDYGQSSPPGGYGQPPGGYSPPPPAGYGAPPPPGPYGAPPAAAGYGAAPPYAGQPAPGVPLGSWIQRVAGYIIDYLVPLPGAIIAAIAIVAGTSTADPETGTTSLSGAALAVAIVGWLIALVLGAWNRWFRAGRTGQSLGKQVMGLKLVSERTGQPIGAGMAFVRDLAHVVDSIICYIGWLFPLWDVKRQTIADKLVGTLVYDIGMQ